MALATTLQYTESNLIGTLQETIGTDTSSCDIRFIDRVTGVAREPLATTKIFVFGKGSATAPNPNYEIVLASHTTTSNVTTLTSMVRGLEFSGISLASVTARKKQHLSGAEVGVVDLHYYSANIVATLKGVGDVWSCLKVATHAARNADITPNEGQIIYVNDYECFEQYRNGVWWLVDPVFTNSTQRDAAIPAPVNGMKCYNTADGAFQGYVGGSWTNEGTSTTPNGSTSVAGKFQEATTAQVGAGTQVGSTGADLVINPVSVVKTSSGAADENHLVALNAVGQFAEGFIPDIARIVQGRLTFTTGTPFQLTSNVFTTLYFTPYLGNKISLYNGTSWALYTFTERSFTDGALAANTSYYVYIYDNAGTLTLECSATGVTTQDGIWVKSGATTHRLLGFVRTTANTGEFAFQHTATPLRPWLQNVYNRAPVSGWVGGITGTTGTTSGTRAWGNDANNKIDIMQTPLFPVPFLVEYGGVAMVGGQNAGNVVIISSSVANTLSYTLDGDDLPSGSSTFARPFLGTWGGMTAVGTSVSTLTLQENIAVGSGAPATQNGQLSFTTTY